MKSIFGRPRIVTDAQVDVIMDWHRSRKSLRQLAKELGLTHHQVQYVIEHGGQYKQPSPELRTAAIEERRANMRALARAGWL